MNRTLALRLCVPALAGLLMTGCFKIDKDYDFGKLNDDNTAVGDLFTAPLGKITLTLDDIFTDGIDYNGIADFIESIGENADLIGISELPLKFDNTVTLEDMEIDLGEDMIDLLTEEGTLKILMTGTNGIPAEFDLQIEFVQSTTGDVYTLAAFEVPQASGSGDPKEYSQEVNFDAESLTKVSNSDTIRVRITSDVKSVKFSADDELIITLKVEKTGGIKLF